MCASPEAGPGPRDVPQAAPQGAGLTPKQFRRRLRGFKFGVGPGLLGWRNECPCLFLRSEAPRARSFLFNLPSRRGRVAS
eukprot:15472459-Alexandrium_andersonii.AAC.1